ncbi:fibronectin type III domain-containing protein [Akkermansiaceae bacterium]|nr:fibronectin type III domain-containing protein [Akkermansiaceae bacterium]
MKLTGALVVSMMSSQAETVFGGADTVDVDNWITSSVPFDDTVQSGHSLNWENVVVNDVTVDSAGNKFDLEWEATTDYMIGHLYIYNESYDLASDVGGIRGLLMTADFEATGFTNWSPVLAVTDGGVTNYYRWNHSGNDFNGNGAQDFSNNGQFDLSQLGNAPNPATGIWGKLNSASTNFGGTRTNNDGPNLQAAIGTVQFGFLQWGGSGGSALPNQTFSTAIESFEVVINPDGVSAPVVVTSPGSALTATSISAAGEVTDTGNETPTVTIYYGTTDGGTDEFAWEGFFNAGAQVGVFSATIEGLTQNTTYFYRAFAMNSAGSAWADSSESVSTSVPSTPSVVVLSGSSSGAGSLTMNGEVTDNGNEDPEVTIFYGTTDGGTNAGAWDEVVFAGVSNGAFSVTVTNLPGDTTFFYRAFAENSGGLAWSDTTESGTTLPFVGVPVSLDSSAFDFQYEMDENPSSQDLDGAGVGSDWFVNPAQASGVDQQMWTPQTYEDGIGSSNQGAVIPEALFRSDFTGSISRESLSGDFTVEVAIQLSEGTIASPDFDLGGFGMFINPPDQAAFRLNINEDEVSTGTGNDMTATANNTGGMTVFRIAYVEADQRYWVWRDGALVYGDTVSPGGGVEGSETSLYLDGGFLLGDFASDLSGDWDIDYIRLHNEAVAPTGVNSGKLLITGFGFVDANTVAIDFVGESRRDYSVRSSPNLTGFATNETPINGTTGTTDAEGVGRVEINVAGRVIDQLFFRVERF